MGSRRAKLFIAIVFAAALAPQSAHAGGPVQWDPSPATPGIQGGTGTWNTSSASWVSGGVNGPWSSANGDTAVFDITPGSVMVSSVLSAAGLEFDVAGYKITPQTTAKALTLTTGAIVANADASISNPLFLPAGLTKTGAGTLTLAAANTVTGSIAVQGGTLAFSAESSLGAAATAPLSLTGGGRLQYTGVGTLNLAAARTLTVSLTGGGLDMPAGPVNLIAAGQLAGAGELSKSGAATLQITAANSTFAGSLRLTGGTLLLTHTAALNGRPVTLAAGHLSLRADAPQNFQSAITVTADAAIDVDRLDGSDPATGGLSVGDVAVQPAATLAVNGNTGAFLVTTALDLAGGLRINNAAVRVTGAFSGAGPVTFGPAQRLPESFTLGLQFINAAAQTVSNSIASADLTVDRLALGVGAATTVSYAGAWAGGGPAAQNYVELRDGGSFTLAPAAHLNTTTADLATARPFRVNGNGLANSFDLGAGFIADHTLNATTADGLSALEVRGATLISRASQSLPVITLKDGFGGTHRAGRLTFSGTAAVSWLVTDANQSYDGGITFLTATTLRTDADLNHIGTVNNKFDAQFQIPTAGVTLTKTGPARLTLAGAQGYAPGTTVSVTAGALRFATDPGAGYFDGNFTRGPDGNVLTTPPAMPTLAIVASAGAVEFATPVSRIASLQLTNTAAAKILPTPQPGQSTLSTQSLSIANTSQLDLANGRLVLNYTGQSGPALAAVAALVKSAYNPAGPRWQGPGLTSSTAAADASLALGYAEAADVLRLAPNQTATVGNETVDATTILVRLTRPGDANLDGMVTLADLQRLELAYNKPGTWANGDFNYDGQVNRADYALFLANYAVPLPTASPDSAPATSVPEPAALLWCVLTVGAARRPRRRRS